MSEAHVFAIGILLAWLAGVRAYLTVFGVGIAGYFGWLHLPPALEVTTSPWVLGISGLLAAVEFFADKIPGLDSLWDMTQTFVRVPAGALLAAGVFGGDQASWALIAALMGGTLAATSHLAKASTRAAVNTTPEPFSNIGLSLLGDAAVPTMLWLAWAHPSWFFAGLAVALLLMVATIVLLMKFLRRLLQRWRRRDAGSISA